MPRNQKWRNNYYVRDIILGMEESKDVRHSRGCSMVNSVSAVEETEVAWHVLSSSGDGSSYRVHRINEGEHDCMMSEKWCDIKCYRCDACREKYNCDCPDYQGKENMCKHIHAVCMFLNGNTDQENEAAANVAEVVVPLRETRDIGTQSDGAVTPLGPLPGTSRQENSEAHRPTSGNCMEAIPPLVPSSGSGSDSPERPQKVGPDLKSRILTDAAQVPRKILVKYDQLDEPELRRVRVLLKQLLHIVRDAN